LKKKVKIFGAGSIGNHLTNAAINLGFSVDVFDNDPEALKRMRNDIYISRYEKWDNNIQLFDIDHGNNKDYDLICIGTPPDTHLDILLEVLVNYKGKILIEKPLCEPTKQAIKKLKKISKERAENIYVGYNHVVSKASRVVEDIINNDIGEILNIDVEFREHWGGIFRAHPWLSGPEESYLGQTLSGGGSSGEHSHALNLWQHFSRLGKLGSVNKVFAKFDTVRRTKLDYDSKSYFILETDKGFTGSVTQDVNTTPSRKIIKIQGSKMYLEWTCNKKDNDDSVYTCTSNGKENFIKIQKNRPDDFIIELEHIIGNKSDLIKSPINLEHGLNTMKVLVAANASNQSSKVVEL
jgi:predicted dehydrogenase